MSSHYKFTIEYLDDSGANHWKISRRDGAEWTGTFDVASVNEDVDDAVISFDIKFDRPIDRLPAKGHNLLKNRIQRILMYSIMDMLKKMEDDLEYVQQLADQYKKEMQKKASEQ